MLIALLYSVLLAAPGPSRLPVGVTAYDPAASQAADGRTPAAEAEKKPAQEKKPKVKKAKKVAKETDPAPDEPVDPEAADTGRGLRVSWKQHPSLRYGSIFRVDFEAKLQEDGHSSYAPVKGLNTWELHRNRFGVQRHLFKRIEYEIERDFTEKELTEKDVLLGITPSSHRGTRAIRSGRARRIPFSGTSTTARRVVATGLCCARSGSRSCASST